MRSNDASGHQVTATAPINNPKSTIGNPQSALFTSMFGVRCSIFNLSRPHPPPRRRVLSAGGAGGFAPVRMSVIWDRPRRTQPPTQLGPTPTQDPRRKRSRYEEPFNRHLVFYGTSTNYATRLNSLKTISWLQLVSEVTHE